MFHSPPPHISPMSHIDALSWKVLSFFLHIIMQCISSPILPSGHPASSERWQGSTHAPHNFFLSLPHWALSSTLLITPPQNYWLWQHLHHNVQNTEKCTNLSTFTSKYVRTSQSLSRVSSLRTFRLFPAPAEFLTLQRSDDTGMKMDHAKRLGNRTLTLTLENVWWK